MKMIRGNTNILKYPKNIKEFFSFLKSNEKYSLIYSKLGCPTPFDVTLRDGLQGLTYEQQTKITLEIKKHIYGEIYFKQNPSSIEIGSITSDRLFPIFRDTVELYKYVNKYQNQKYNNSNLFLPLNVNNYILIPNSNKLNEVINEINNQNFSFITSVSNSFQLKNTKMSLDESDNDILNMMYLLDEQINKNAYQVKLYVSCINECPIDGKIDSNKIIDRLLKLNSYKVDYICLSDTCGTLELSDFKYIVDKCITYGIPSKKLSIHLHVKNGREDIIEQIINYALDVGIINFDVSLLETGGCSVTIDNNKLYPNLSYDLYYKSLCKYIYNKSK